jgi:hypothetical protein
LCLPCFWLPPSSFTPCCLELHNTHGNSNQYETIGNKKDSIRMQPFQLWFRKALCCYFFTLLGVRVSPCWRIWKIWVLNFGPFYFPTWMCIDPPRFWFGPVSAPVLGLF